MHKVGPMGDQSFAYMPGSAKPKSLLSRLAWCTPCCAHHQLLLYPVRAYLVTALLYGPDTCCSVTCVGQVSPECCVLPPNRDEHVLCSASQRLEVAGH
jgi:hypothetical protein